MLTICRMFVLAGVLALSFTGQAHATQSQSDAPSKNSDEERLVENMVKGFIAAYIRDIRELNGQFALITFLPVMRVAGPSEVDMESIIANFDAYPEDMREDYATMRAEYFNRTAAGCHAIMYRSWGDICFSRLMAADILLPADLPNDDDEE